MPFILASSQLFAESEGFIPLFHSFANFQLILRDLSPSSHLPANSPLNQRDLSLSPSTIHLALQHDQPPPKFVYTINAKSPRNQKIPGASLSS